MLHSKQLLQACKEKSGMTYDDIAEATCKSKSCVGQQMKDDHELNFGQFEQYVKAMGFRIELVRDVVIHDRIS